MVWPQERNFAAILGGAVASKHYLNRSNWQSLLRKSLGCVVLHSDSKISFQKYGETVIIVIESSSRPNGMICSYLYLQKNSTMLLASLVFALGAAPPTPHVLHLMADE